ncbi:photosystem reaction center subunit H [Halorubellus sp. JP-L1]|uniref:PRC-barrel domain-containing protein n=1 Tax=Halorubellus sp. JP-L1 TaxID=2715753 RepID=UPI00140E34CE|nr:PRC-barrel domain-containing protein [Halorubellus sp. JP-L1]NHN40417.1 photosystem reaction center subunit H [Halorubellus sp. JP-L1]
MDTTPQEITSVVGREVYSNNGVYVGEIEDVRLDIERETVTGLALSGLNTDIFGNAMDGTRGIIVPYRWVRAVGDVVLINDIVERYRGAEEEEEAVA